MFTLMHSDVIRIQLFVPQDQAFGLTPGVDAVVRVPEIPDRTFPGKVTRIASALQPGSRSTQRSRGTCHARSVEAKKL